MITHYYVSVIMSVDIITMILMVGSIEIYLLTSLQ